MQGHRLDRGQRKLSSPFQEVHIAEANDLPAAYVRQVLSFPILSREEETLLGRKAHEGDIEARNALVMHNQRFLMRLVHDYQRRHPGFSIRDLMSEGNMGLIRAAQLFDPSRNVRFIGYARAWILNYLDRFTQDCGPIHIPQHQITALNRLRKAKTDGIADADLSEETGVSEKDIEVLLPHLNSVASLDVPLSDAEDGATLGDIVCASEDDYDALPIADMLTGMLASLPERYRDVLVRRYGVFGEKPMTLQQLADEYGVTKERIRQIEMKALKMCRRYA